MNRQKDNIINNQFERICELSKEIQVLQAENEKLKAENVQLMNRCSVLSNGSLCSHCGFKNKCPNNETESSYDKRD